MVLQYFDIMYFVIQYLNIATRTVDKYTYWQLLCFCCAEITDLKPLNRNIAGIFNLNQALLSCDRKSAAIKDCSFLREISERDRTLPG